MRGRMCVDAKQFIEWVRWFGVAFSLLWWWGWDIDLLLFLRLRLGVEIQQIEQWNP
jgi:hypothetical protein